MFPLPRISALTFVVRLRKLSPEHLDKDSEVLQDLLALINLITQDIQETAALFDLYSSKKLLRTRRDLFSFIGDCLTISSF